jgi:hypothetical protein
MWRRSVVSAVLGLAILGAGLVILRHPSSAQQQTPSTQSPGPLVRGFIAAQVGGAAEPNTASLPIEDIYLPNVRVVVRDLATGTDSEPVTTDLSGRFTARVAAPGRFGVCWEARGFKSDCAGAFAINRRFHNIGTVHIPLPKEPRTSAVYGRVRLADGSSPRRVDPTANINTFATIALVDRGRRIYEVPVNNDDRYLFPQVPLLRGLQVRIRQEGYDNTHGFRLPAQSAPARRIDYTIVNNPPHIDPLVALDGTGRRVSAARVGTSVKLNARVADRDNDSVKFLWQVTAGALSSPTAPEPTWTLANGPGSHAATLYAFDGKGGYAKQSIAVTVDASGPPTSGAGLMFSGIVSGTDTPTLAGALVEVNGKGAVTDSRGFFQVRVPDIKRFVMNIRKPGYGFASNIYYDQVVGGQWQLTRADVRRLDPTREMVVVNERRAAECAGPPSARLRWRENAALLVPQVQDGRGNGMVLTKEATARLVGLPAIAGEQTPRGCGPGIQVKIPANSLVDANRRAPSGPVDIQVSTIDLNTPNQMPGNYTVVAPNGDVKVMQSYGAGIVEIFSGGTKYNLRQGAQAELVIPVDRVQLSAGGPLPPTIPLLTYNEARGFWVQEGTAALKNVNGVQAYVALVKHFTAYNADNIKTDQSCLAVQNQNMPATYAIEMTIPQPSGAAPVKRFFPSVTGGNSEIAILNLPKETNVVVVPIRPADNLPMGVFVVNTGAVQNPAWPKVPNGQINEPQGPPYYHETNGVSDGACSTKLVLQDLGLKFYPDPTVGAFLHGLSTFAAVNLTDTDVAFPTDVDQTLRNAVAAASLDYRHQIDPRVLRPSLSCFKVVNRMPLKAGESCPQHAAIGFTPLSALTETTAVYANSVDLGFGREMHCVKDDTDPANVKVACYVSNYDSLVYTGPGQGSDVTKAQTAVAGFNSPVAIQDATVAMEFSALEDIVQNTPAGTVVNAAVTVADPTSKVVKFYVFNNFNVDPAGQPADAANLDGLGARPVPQLCMVCHGGYIPNPSGISNQQGIGTPVFGSPDDVKLDAKFLPFDLRSFTYASANPTDPFSRNQQEAAFKALNDMVKLAPPPDADPTSQAIEALNTAWYPGNVAPQQDSLPVALWDDVADPKRVQHRNVYQDVVARACRTCHVTNPDPVLRFDRPANFDSKLGLIQPRVCKDHVMPHARRTHDLFWTSLSPSQPAALQAYGDTAQTGGWQVVGQQNVDLSLICGQEYTQGGGPVSPPTQFSPVATILSNCAGCHAAPPNDAAQLTLDPAMSYADIVNIAAFELGTMNRIKGGGGVTPELDSYLWHKLNGAPPPPAGGSGGQMPLFGQPLNATDLNKIKTWIQGGALP